MNFKQILIQQWRNHTVGSFWKIFKNWKFSPRIRNFFLIVFGQNSSDLVVFPWFESAFRMEYFLNFIQNYPHSIKSQPCITCQIRHSFHLELLIRIHYNIFHDEITWNRKLIIYIQRSILVCTHNSNKSMYACTGLKIFITFSHFPFFWSSLTHLVIKIRQEEKKISHVISRVIL